MPNLPEQTANFSEQVENLVRIIKHGKREQALFLVGFLCLGLPAILPEAVIKLLPDFSNGSFPG